MFNLKIKQSQENNNSYMLILDFDPVILELIDPDKVMHC